MTWTGLRRAGGSGRRAPKDRLSMLPGGARGDQTPQNHPRFAAPSRRRRPTDPESSGLFDSRRDRSIMSRSTRHVTPAAAFRPPRPRVAWRPSRPVRRTGWPSPACERGTAGNGIPTSAGGSADVTG